MLTSQVRAHSCERIPRFCGVLYAIPKHIFFLQLHCMIFASHNCIHTENS